MIRNSRSFVRLLLLALGVAPHLDFISLGGLMEIYETIDQDAMYGISEKCEGLDS